MAIESLSTQLERVQAAIAAIESGAQSYRIGNRSLTKADLATLYKRENALNQAIAEEASGGLCITFAATGDL